MTIGDLNKIVSKKLIMFFFCMYLILWAYYPVTIYTLYSNVQRTKLKILKKKNI